MRPVLYVRRVLSSGSAMQEDNEMGCESLDRERVLLITEGGVIMDPWGLRNTKSRVRRLSRNSFVTR